jgi:anti-sigma B factor antagonist
MDRFSTPLLSVTRIPGDRGMRLALEGELDLATTPILQASLDSAEHDGEPIVELDLTDLSFVDASGLKAILHAHRRAIRLGGDGIALLNPSFDIRRLLSLTAIDLTIEVERDPATPAAAV